MFKSILTLAIALTVTVAASASANTVSDKLMLDAYNKCGDSTTTCTPTEVGLMQSYLIINCGE